MPRQDLDLKDLDLKLLAYIEVKLDKTTSLQKLLSTKINAETVYVMELHLDYANIAKKFSLNIPLCPEKKKVPICEDTDVLRNTNPKITV